eukprot:4819979-Amphidinium_carterae.1
MSPKAWQKSSSPWGRRGAHMHARVYARDENAGTMYVVTYSYYTSMPSCFVLLWPARHKRSLHHLRQLLQLKCENDVPASHDYRDPRLGGCQGCSEGTLHASWSIDRLAQLFRGGEATFCLVLMGVCFRLQERISKLEEAVESLKGRLQEVERDGHVSGPQDVFVVVLADCSCFEVHAEVKDKKRKADVVDREELRVRPCTLKVALKVVKCGSLVIVNLFDFGHVLNLLVHHLRLRWHKRQTLIESRHILRHVWQGKDTATSTCTCCAHTHL